MNPTQQSPSVLVSSASTTSSSNVITQQTNLVKSIKAEPADFSITVPFNAASSIAQSTGASSTNIKLENIDRRPSTESNSDANRTTAQIVTNRRPSFSQVITTTSTQVICGQVTSGTSVVNISMRSDGNVIQSTKESTLSNSPPSDLGSPASLGDDEPNSATPPKPSDPARATVTDAELPGQIKTAAQMRKSSVDSIGSGEKRASMSNIMTGDGMIVNVVSSSSTGLPDSNVIPTTQCTAIIANAPPASATVIFGPEEIKREKAVPVTTIGKLIGIMMRIRHYQFNEIIYIRNNRYDVIGCLYYAR